MNKLSSFFLWALYEMYGKAKYETVLARGRIPGHLRRPSDAELSSYFATAGVGGYDKRVHWCGIFQTYLLKKAGVACHWSQKIVDDSNGKDLEIVTGKDAQKGLAIGDIVRIHHDEHHFIVLESVTSGFIRGLEGNAQGPEHPTIACNWMGNMSHNIVEDVYMRYRVVG